MNKILGLIFVTLVSCNFIKNTDMLDINEKSKYIIDAKVNEKVSFAVTTNLTTGYNWQINIDSTSSDVKLVLEEYKNFVDTPDEIVGAPVSKVYTVQPLKSGIHTLKLVYKRGWENNDGVNKKEVVLNVTQ